MPTGASRGFATTGNDAWATRGSSGGVVVGLPSRLADTPAPALNTMSGEVVAMQFTQNEPAATSNLTTARFSKG